MDSQLRPLLHAARRGCKYRGLTNYCSARDLRYTDKRAVGLSFSESQRVIVSRAVMFGCRL